MVQLLAQQMQQPQQLQVIVQQPAQQAQQQGQQFVVQQQSHALQGAPVVFMMSPGGLQALASAPPIALQTAGPSPTSFLQAQPAPAAVQYVFLTSAGGLATQAGPAAPAAVPMQQLQPAPVQLAWANASGSTAGPFPLFPTMVASPQQQQPHE